MRTLLSSLAVLALIFAIGCGDDDKAGHDGHDDHDDGCGPAHVDDDKPSDTPAKTDGDAAKMVGYKCAACGKTASLPTDATAPS